MELGIVSSGDSSLPVERLAFHERCGLLIRLTNGNRTAERRCPMDEFNNGIVMTNRPLHDNELFEVEFCQNNLDVNCTVILSYLAIIY